MACNKFRWLRKVILGLMIIILINAGGQTTLAYTRPVEVANGADAGLQGKPAALTAEEWNQITRAINSNFNQQAYLKASNVDANDKFGYSVAISGDTLVVGACYEDGNGTSQGDNSASASGAAYVFVRDGATWTQQAYLKASNVEANDWFGTSVAISGDTLVIGAPSEDGNGSNQDDNSAPNAGAAYVFVRDGATWTQQAYLKASNAEVNDQFGTSGAISGDTLVVGAHGEDGNGTSHDDNSTLNAGAAYVFVRDGTSWSQQAYLKASNVDASDLFGYSVAISGDTLVVGADGEDGNGTSHDDNSTLNAGAAYVFVRDGTSWSQQAYLKASNVDANDHFGFSVAISGDTLVVGAMYEDGNGSNQGDNSAFSAGAAYAFVRSGTAWSQQAYLKASNVNANDLFGCSVAISGDTLVVGAYVEDGNGSSQGDNSASYAGAAYAFLRDGVTWSQQAYLKASNVEEFDQFGTSVAISGDTLVVGAPTEDGNGSSQDDNSAPDAGAAYVFTKQLLNYLPLFIR